MEEKGVEEEDDEKAKEATTDAPDSTDELQVDIPESESLPEPAPASAKTEKVEKKQFNQKV